jgi:hypothetical protein
MNDFYKRKDINSAKLNSRLIPNLMKYLEDGKASVMYVAFFLKLIALHIPTKITEE